MGGERPTEYLGYVFSPRQGRCISCPERIARGFLRERVRRGMKDDEAPAGARHLRMPPVKMQPVCPVIGTRQEVLRRPQDTIGGQRHDACHLGILQYLLRSTNRVIDTSTNR
jgi:hypothetical protein